MPGIWAMEAPWSSDVADRRTVLPLFEALGQSQAANFVRLQINRRADLVEALRKWSLKKHGQFEIGYFGMHGYPGGISIGKDDIDLVKLADELSGRGLAEKTIHFSGCSVLRGEGRSEEILDAFHCRAVSGFTKPVEFLEGLGFELIFFDVITQFTYLGSAKKYLEKNYGELIDRLGFAFEVR
ncbi:DUF6642 family protein [Janibacter massiliensis]|uniref:DUF6642 family protein n=1 Tax=Janibacter massiliensis TaxID=2058291 RepID=UPI000D0E70DD|nr:hypothetical protein [Janibacter massiliensis]